MTPLFRALAGSIIARLASKLPPDDRDDFTQDMWVHLLQRSPLNAYETFCAGPSKPLDGFLNIVLFRAAENRVERVRSAKRAMPSDPSDPVFEQAVEPDTSGIQARENELRAASALKVMRATLTESERFTSEEIDTVMTGFVSGKDKAHIARSIGRSPQFMGLYFSRARRLPV